MDDISEPHRLRAYANFYAKHERRVTAGLAQAYGAGPVGCSWKRLCLPCLKRRCAFGVCRFGPSMRRLVLCPASRFQRRDGVSLSGRRLSIGLISRVGRRTQRQHESEQAKGGDPGLDIIPTQNHGRS